MPEITSLPTQLQENETYILTNNITLTTLAGGIGVGINLVNGVTFDGNGKTITYTGAANWKGLFNPVSDVNGIRIQNIKLVLTNSSIAQHRGGILGSSYDYENRDAGVHNIERVLITIDNCSVDVQNDTATSVGAGGICGIYAGGFNGSCIVSNCYFTGNIGIRGGGICGWQAAKTGGECLVSNCYSIGNIGVVAAGSTQTWGNAGGIMGQHADNGTRVSNCYSIGSISTTGSGGICGQFSKNQAVVENCISRHVTGNYTGGGNSSNALDGDSTRPFPNHPSGHGITSDGNWDDGHAVKTIGQDSAAWFAGNTGAPWELMVFRPPPAAAADICFPAGTPVTTDQGAIAIEKLIPGTHTIKEKPIVGISQTKSTDDHLLCFEKHALGHNIPDQQTIVSREHCILYKGKMKRACTFMRYARIRKIKYTGETLYNVVLEKHGSMVVNNMTVETLHPKHWVAKKLFCSTFSKS